MTTHLIFTAGFGEGHNTAARNLRDALKILSPEADVEVLDILEECYPRLNPIVRKAYIGAINRTPTLWSWIYRALDKTPLLEANLASLSLAKQRFAELLDARKPASVICTYPLFNYFVQQLFGEAERPFTQFTVVTDSISINSIWHRAPSDFFLVANEATHRAMLAAGVSEAQLRTLGFPVTPRFAELTANGFSRPEPGPGSPAHVLVMLNSDHAEVESLVTGLARIPNVKLTVTTGRDETLRNRVESVAGAINQEVEIHGWTPKISDLIARSHVIIGKAGGATVQEAIAACTPMIISQIVPGQEEGNASLVLESGAGCYAPTTEAILHATEYAFSAGAAPWRRWEEQIRHLSRPTAALEMARFILESQKVTPR